MSERDKAVVRRLVEAWIAPFRASFPDVHLA
jgi:hypothetical protein